MNIGVDIKSFACGFSGIQKYMTCILDELQLIDAENKYYLFECRESRYVPTNPNWEKILCEKWKLPVTVWQQLIFPRQLKKYKLDIFWAPEQTAPVFWMPSGTKTVITVHDFVARRYPETCQTTDLIIKKWLSPLAMRASYGLVPVSDRIKKELFDFYPGFRSTSKIIRTVNNGATNRGRVEEPVGRENFLFFPGNLEPRKNLTRLVKALEIVNASGIELDLHICGPAGWKNSSFHKLIETSPVRTRIKHLGYLSDTDLRNQYLKCKALVFPSIYEGFGIPVIEALSLNTPVLTSKGTVMEDIAGDSAMYFDPYDVESISAAIIKFLKDGPVPIDREILKKYTWRKSAEDLLEVFRELQPRG